MSPEQLLFWNAQAARIGEELEAEAKRARA